MWWKCLGAEKDHELILQNVVQEKAKYFRAVRRLFAQWPGAKRVKALQYET